uniref:WH2 domain-containing protein n=1 Tax=Caenorhabditis tropicalis TaxID=1561998 RepID=A0A1I7TNV5_9PELO
MTTRYDYSLLEFTANLAEAEATYGQKLQSIIDTFSQSRLDLPLKRLSEIAKVHNRTAANLKKYMDPKKNEHLNLWKMCNVYSCGAVDLDKAMRETRASLRTKMAVDGTVVEKPKRRNLFNSIQNHLNSSKSSSEDSSKERKWFPRLPEKRLELRTSRKNTSSSVEEKELNGTTPPTPPIIRAHSQITTSASIAPDSQKPPRPPIRSQIPEPPSSVPPPPPVSAPPQFYATPIYGDLQKASIANNNNRVGMVAEHSLRHTDDTPSKEMAVVRIRTDVDVARETRSNETITNVYDSPSINKSHYVNIRPPIAQKPKIMAPERPPPPRPSIDSEPIPTFISVDCYPTTVPVPSPRSFYNSSTNETPPSQRSSSSAYSSNYSSSSSSNVTSFAVDSPPEVVENARYVRVASPDGLLHRF